jgi:aspartate/methionine/tyrosine aminotransferase
VTNPVRFSTRTDWPLARNRLTEAVDQARAQGMKILDLTISNPTRAGFAQDASILHALARPESLDYDPQPKGLGQAREAVAAYYRDDHGVALDTEQIILTASTSEAYSYIFRLLCNPGDEVLVPKPSYPLFDFLAGLQDVKLVPYSLLYDHGWQMDFPTLERALTTRTRGVVLVHPNNPTGSFVQTEERATLNEICSRRGLALIVDEVFLDYAHGRGAEASFSGTFAANPQALTFTMSGLSKISSLPQMKLAWMVVSGPELDTAAALERLEVIADTYLSVSAPVQWAAGEMLAARKLLRQQLMERVQRNLSELDRRLASVPSCQRLRVDGGWYAVLRVPATRSDDDLAVELVHEKQVLVHPGHFYDFPSDGYLVLSLIGPEEQFGEGVGKLLEIAD